MTFGDHATFIVSGAGNGIGGMGGQGSQGASPVTVGAPPTSEGPATGPGTSSRQGRRMSMIVAVSTVLGTVFTAGAFVVGLPGFKADDDKPVQHGAAPLNATSTPPAEAGAATPGTGSSPAGSANTSGAKPVPIFDDVVTIDQNAGVDLDTGRSKKHYQQNADTDLYLGIYHDLYTSARNWTAYDDTNAGTEEGAYARCRDYRLTGRPTVRERYVSVGGNSQYCFTTSAGHPAWVASINQVGDQSQLVKVAVWDE
ncbi:hypothetical protein SAMN06264365_102183 [Actinoplanes regularis]|uniref:Uncharacterized protein n=2 Tax=Actinoplanes regularis TaxID=52697 RepID=A0A238W588_9ACTN|nr:hypothetical protein Are01nite_17240 [Actinoplanes regularis]SNR41720.1 hypothetical protein SAMN06264365_102183 [Actinoplanes regularis]